MRRQDASSPSPRLLLPIAVASALILLATAAPGPASSSILPDIDRFVAALAEAHNLPGLAVAITQGDRVMQAGEYGQARPGEPMTADTHMFIASLSKSFTALAVMQLAEAGRIELDAPLETYLTDFSVADETTTTQLTVRQLLNQTSGLGDAGYPEGRLPHPSSLDDVVSHLRRASPVAPPGAEFNYFNPNYQLLARLVEVVSGENFSDYLDVRVFRPLQMGDTFAVDTSDQAIDRADRLARGHVMAYGFGIGVDEMSGFLGGSGGVISTANDMANSLIMHANEGQFADLRLISAESVELMHTPPEGVDSDYAMGWIETTIAGAPALHHEGVLSAFYADMVLLPQTGHGIVLLYNAGSVASNAIAASQIRTGLVRLLTDRQASNGSFTMRLYGGIWGVITLVTAAIGVRGILRFPDWQARARLQGRAGLSAGILSRLLPGVVLWSFPWLIGLGSGRAFSHPQLLRAMPEVYVWLTMVSVFGIVTAIRRTGHLARTGRG